MQCAFGCYESLVSKMSTLGYSYIDAEPSLKNLTAAFGKIPEKQDEVCGLSVANDCELTGF
jgi:hypothetical protein